MCSIEGCHRKHYGRGWCNAHYLRWRKYGDPLATAPKPTPEDRFWRYVDKTDTCWLWTGYVRDDGYGEGSIDGRGIQAHRLAYLLLVGPIPEGMHVDHVYANGCRHRHCVNPAHLEAVTPAENVRRAAARTTHCPQGHPYDEANTYVPPGKVGGRTCRVCGRARRAAA